MQVVPLRFCHLGSKRSVLWPKIRQNPFSGRPTGELTTLPRLPSRMGRGQLSPYLTPLGTDAAPCVPRIPARSTPMIYFYKRRRGVHGRKGERNGVEGPPWVYLYIFLRLAYGVARKSLLQRIAALTATLKCVRVTAMTLQWTSLQCVCVCVRVCGS